MSKRKLSLTTNAISVAFRKDQIDTKLKLSNPICRAILNECNLTFMGILLDSGSISLGNTLGYIEIFKFKQKRVAHSHALSLVNKRKSYGFNSHSDGYTYRVYWNRYSKISLNDKFMWHFKSRREFRKYDLAKALFEKRVDYPIKLKKYLLKK